MQNQGIARQAVSGSTYSIFSSGITLILGATRSILLARLLLPEYFGVIALALVFTSFVANLRNIGLDLALVHRQDADQAFMRTYFSLRAGLDLLAAGLLLAAIPLLQKFYPQTPQLGQVLAVLVIAFLISNMSQVQESLLRKNLDFKSLAITDVAASFVMTSIAPYLAWRGWGLWALVAEQVSGITTRFLLTWGPFRQWRPAFGWDRKSLGFLWSYGKKTWMATNLVYYLNRFDDFWIGTSLGDVFLGYYSKAFEFAHYPTRLIANQLIAVFTPVFARLQKDRIALSQAFYRSAHVILRTGAFAAGALALVLPEFIHFVIGDKWLPMLWTFRLMLIYAVLEPVLTLIKNLFFSTGHPREVLKISTAQVLFFTPAVILGATFGDINGVALAADGMLVAGIWKAFSPLRRLVDFSPYRLAGRPFIALTIALAVGLWAEQVMQGQIWLILLAKFVLYLLLYTALMLIMERKDYIKGLQLLWTMMRPKRERQAGI
jgi:O-antigen/teichoic acid export membrane protein